MRLKVLPQPLTVCKLPIDAAIDLSGDFYFIGRTDGELSLVCPTAQTPADTVAREDGWRGFRVEGELDFSLVGILAGISAILAEVGVSLFAVSTYNTDYILVKREDLPCVLDALAARGYDIEY